MAGKIKIMCCQGKSKDTRYPFYPYWRLKVIGDDGKEVTATVCYEDKDQLGEALQKILLHEKRVDIIRHRKAEYPKWKKFFQKLTSYYEQLTLGIIFIPAIYTKFVKFGYEVEITLGEEFVESE